MLDPAPPSWSEDFDDPRWLSNSIFDGENFSEDQIFGDGLILAHRKHIKRSVADRDSVFMRKSTIKKSMHRFVDDDELLIKNRKKPSVNEISIFLCSK